MIAQRIEDKGAHVEAGPPEQLGALMRSELEKWTRLARPHSAAC